MQPLSAAQRLQQAHEAAQNTAQPTDNAVLTEDPFPPFGFVAHDPFPPANLAPPVPAPEARQKQTKSSQVDVSDESAFPSLGAPVTSGKSKAPSSLWGSGAAALRAKQVPAGGDGAARDLSPAPSVSTRSSTPAAVAAAAQVSSTTLQIPTASISISPPASYAHKGPRGFSNERRETPTTLGEVIKEVTRRIEGVAIDASSSRNLTTFIVKAKGNKAEDKVDKARNELLAWLEKKVTEEVQVPKSLRAVIIGAKGRTLKTITDSTGALIQIPRDDESAATPAAESADDSPEDGPLISISLSGPQSAVDSARSQILAIVRERTSKTSVRLGDIPSEYWALLGSRVAQVVERAGVEEGEVRIDVPRRWTGKRGVDVLNESGEEAVDEKKEKERAVSVSGARDAVKKVVAELEAELAELRATVRPVTFPLPKRQHRFLVGSAIADRILHQTGCAVEVPPAESPSEDVVVRGPARETVKAMQLVMDVASATPVETLDLFTAHRGAHDPRMYAAQLARFLIVKSRLRPIALASGTQIYLPRLEAIPASQNAWLEIVGSSGEEGTGVACVAQARQAVISEVRKLPPGVFDIVRVDPLVHRHLIGKKGNKVRQFEKDHAVEVVFPPSEQGRNDVLLVYTGEHYAGPEAKQALEQVKQAIEALAGEFADMTSEVIEIPAALHGAVIGQGGTTLNAVIGEDKLVHVQFGGAGAKEDEVAIRGPKDEVERVKKELQRIAEDAKNEEIVNSHVIEFEIPSEHVRHIVGKAGSGVNKLREELGVRVDFGDQAAAAKKGATSKVTVKGRKENAEEARKRIKSLVTRMADEVTLTIPLPASLDRGSLIGKQGMYLKRLQEKYDCVINFPKDGRRGHSADSALPTPSPSEITIRGPSKGAKAAQGELVALIEYEKEHGNTVAFEVLVKALPRILGRGGSQVNQIKDETGVASLDIDQEDKEATSATITLRGTKSSIKKAREAIEKIAKDVQDELRIEIDIPREYHTTLIGSGGSSIRDLIARCGGPTDARASGNTVRFPRQGDAKDTVVITAPTSVANKIKAALESEVDSLASRVVWGVVVPSANHAAVIGRGAQALQDLQRKHGVKVVLPGWKDYAEAGEPENQDELADANERDVVKVVGPKESALAASDDLQAVKGRGTGAASGSSTPSAHSVEVLVPKKLHAQVAQGGRFFRSLPSGTRVSHRGVKPPSSTLKAKKPPAPASNGTNSAARIDDDADDSNGAEEEAGIDFQLVSLHDEGDAHGADADETIPWVVESRSAEDAEQVAEDIRKNLARAQEASHVGWVTVPRGLMPRIVGRGGAGLDRLRATGVEVDVVGKRDANQLTLTGSPSAIDAAYDVIRELNAPRPPRGRRNQEYDNY
ncbi:SCP160 protein [Rhodotorula toruloides]|uniref:SCP160 protein n=1 Tax=Rhodotorula toruloides TaxID=5286 RepID=A0A511KDK6_RHOTO|nr:SCP160 protein [Rhodotorula toruloides]